MTSRSTKNKLVRLSDLLAGGAPSLARLVQAAKRAETLTDCIRRSVPEEVAAHLVSVGIRGRTLVLVADSAAWGTRLRYLSCEILTFVPDGQEPAPTMVVVKVRPGPIN